MIDVDQIVEQLHKTPSDINEHLPTILKYGKECEHITEMGVRGIVSLWGWLKTKPKKLVAYDYIDPSNWGGNINDVYEAAKQLNVEFEFKIADTREIVIEETDMLFIDTEHTYSQLSTELKLHGNKARNYLAFHDTAWCYELNVAIEEFQDQNPHWTTHEVFKNNYGFTVLKRV